MENNYFLLFCTCPPDLAAGLAQGLVENRLAACVNILPGATSVYRWEGRIENDSESVLLVKTTEAALGSAQAWLQDQHPYELPEIIAVPIQAGLPEYLDWIGHSVGRPH